MGIERLRDLINDGGHELTLVCQIRGGLCGLPLVHVVETMRPLPIEPVAGAPSFVLGLALIRGVAVPVVEAAHLLAGKDVAPAESDRTTRRFVTLDVGGRPVALAVNGVVGVRSIAAASRGALPRLLSHAASDVIETVGALDAELLVVLQAGHLLPQGFPAP
jgi:purine-binding chemotaxis protein CheW